MLNRSSAVDLQPSAVPRRSPTAPLSVSCRFIMVVLVLWWVLLISILAFQSGSAAVLQHQPLPDTFLQFNDLVPGSARENLARFELLSIQRTANNWSMNDPEISIAPQSGPFYLIRLEVDQNQIVSTTFYTDQLCDCELYRKWGEPDKMLRLLDGRSYMLRWYTADYVVSAVLRPLPGDSGVRVVSLSFHE